MNRSSMTSKGQVTIPAHIRAWLGLKPGDQVEFDLEAGIVTLVPVKKGDNPFAAFAGTRPQGLKSMEDVRRWTAERRDEDEA